MRAHAYVMPVATGSCGHATRLCRHVASSDSMGYNIHSSDLAIALKVLGGLSPIALRHTRWVDAATAMKPWAYQCTCTRLLFCNTRGVRFCVLICPVRYLEKHMKSLKRTRCYLRLRLNCCCRAAVCVIADTTTILLM